jgi:hypothetical protein
MPPVRRVRNLVDEETAMTADQIRAERELAIRARANPSIARGRTMLKERHTKPDYDPTLNNEMHIDERQKLRERVLQLSLFPNLYNKLFLEANMQ